MTFARRIMLGFLCAFVAALTACANTTGRIDLDVDFRLFRVLLNLFWTDGGHHGGHATVVVPDGSGVVGMCARMCSPQVDGTKVCGETVELGPGENLIPVPPGSGEPQLEFVECPEDGGDPDSPATSGAGFSPRQAVAVPLRAYGFAQAPAPVDVSGVSNLAYAVLLEARNYGQAIARRDELVELYGQVLQGVDPGPFPGWVSEASFSSYRLLPDGSAEFIVAHPGERVDDFRLDVNGVDSYATLQQGAVETSVGAWKVVMASVQAADIEFPTAPGVPVQDAYRIVLATDTGVVDHACNYTFRLDP